MNLLPYFTLSRVIPPSFPFVVSTSLHDTTRASFWNMPTVRYTSLSVSHEVTRQLSRHYLLYTALRNVGYNHTTNVITILWCISRCRHKSGFIRASGYPITNSSRYCNVQTVGSPQSLAAIAEFHDDKVALLESIRWDLLCNEDSMRQ